MRAVLWAWLGFFVLALGWQWHRWWSNPGWVSEIGWGQQARQVAQVEKSAIAMDSSQIDEKDDSVWRYYEILTQPDGLGGLRVWSLKWIGQKETHSLAFDGQNPEAWLERHRHLMGIQGWRRLGQDPSGQGWIFEAWDAAGRRYRLSWISEGGRLVQLQLERW